MSTTHSQREAPSGNTLSSRKNDPAQLHLMQPLALNPPWEKSQLWVIKRSHSGTEPSETKHVLLKCIDICYGKIHFSCCFLPRFCFPASWPGGRKGLLRQMEFFQWVERRWAVILYMKLHLLAPWSRKWKKDGNKPCQQFIHRRRLSQAFKMKKTKGRPKENGIVGHFINSWMRELVGPAFL